MRGELFFLSFSRISKKKNAHALFSSLFPSLSLSPPLFIFSASFYRICRQPNLLGEVLFWWGTAAAGAPALLASAKAGAEGGKLGSSSAVALAAAAAAGVAAITAIVVGDSKKKTRDQEARMRGKSGWREFAARTPALWPVPRRG